MIESRPVQIQRKRHPLFCQWEITCRCNLRCVMCYTDCFNTAEKVREELSTEEIIHIMDELKEAGCAELVLTGGEPLARLDFFEIYEHAVRSGFLVTVFTNATLITGEIADRFTALPPHKIEISLHGVSAGTFDQVTQQQGSFDKCLKAIGFLLERQIPILIKTTAMTINRDEIIAVKKQVESLPAVQFRLGFQMRPALNGSQAPSQYEIPDSEIDQLFQTDAQLHFEACEAKGRKKVCQSGRFKFHIDAYGQLQLCSGNRRQGYDLRKGSFKEGFYQHLPSFPCAFKPKPLESQLVSSL